MIRPTNGGRLPSHPYRTPSPRIPSAPWHWRPLALFAALCVWAYCVGVVNGCTPSTRQHVIAVGNVVAAASDAGGLAIVRAYCAASMASIGRDGTWTGGHCVASGPNADRAATSDELAELARVRVAWRPVMAAHEAVARSHNTLVAVLAAADAVEADSLLLALAHVVDAYGELAAAARALGLQLPTLGGVR